MIAGVRPEHFEDARFAADLEHSLKFDIEVDVVEEMGSELYAFFSVKSDALHSDDLDDLAEDAGRHRARREGQERGRRAAERGERRRAPAARPSSCSTRTRSRCSTPTGRT